MSLLDPFLGELYIKLLPMIAKRVEDRLNSIVEF
jgi:hypothetical protein